MEIDIREATTSDFNQINALFREFAEFENLPERMTNTVDQGCHRLRWQVSEWNKPAIDFYKKLEATISGVEQYCDLSFSF